MLLSSKGLNWNKGYIVPFTVYFDDSGTDPNQPVANASGLIIPAKRILALEGEWAALKKKEGFGDFHTSEFVARNRDSEFANWDDAKHKRVFRRVREITKKYGAQVFSFSVRKIDYNECVPREIRKYSGEYHYSFAIRQVSMFAQIWRSEKGISEPYEWLFDWMEKKDPTRKEIERMFEEMEHLNRQHGGAQHEYTHLDFRTRASLAGLQCADLLAWTNYNFSLQQWKLLKRPLHPFAKLAWDDFAAKPKASSPAIAKFFKGGATLIDWNNVIVLTRAQLQEWAKEKLGDSRLKLVKHWHEHRKAKSALSR